jgi:5-methylcytosine-specific restriction endonuclease McrA
MPSAWRLACAQLRGLCEQAGRCVCAICGHPINLLLHHEHPMSFTVDHIIPRSLGGPDTLDNARPAHRRCNSQRGADVTYQPALKTSRAW